MLYNKQSIILLISLLLFTHDAVSQTPFKFAGNLPSPEEIEHIWDKENTSSDIKISKDKKTISWETDKYFAWQCAESEALLKGKDYQFDFEMKGMSDAQMAVGFLVNPIDWGFYGYLGAGQNAYAYDPSSGHIVTETRELFSGLTKIKNSGKVTLRLYLSRHPQTAVFIVNETESPIITLPDKAEVIPGACLFKKGQSVKITNIIAPN